MNTTPSPAAPDPAGSEGRRALVLGGGGSTGNAWLIGVVAGPVDAGLDVTAADVIVGTSAGSTAAAQISGATPPELYQAILAEGPAAPAPPRQGSAAATNDHLERLRRMIADSDDLADFRRRMSAMALAAPASSDAAAQGRWHDTVASRFPCRTWPDRTVLITAVEASTGEPVVFDRFSGASLVDAVAASCAGGFAYGIDGVPLIDGGYRTNSDNADLASGCGRVLVLSPLGGRSFHPDVWGTHLAAQVEALHAEGSRVETVFPEPSEGHLFGTSAMNPSLRPAAARVGHEQGTALAGHLTEFWTGASRGV